MPTDSPTICHRIRLLLDTNCDSRENVAFGIKAQILDLTAIPKVVGILRGSAPHRCAQYSNRVRERLLN